MALSPHRPACSVAASTTHQQPSRYGRKPKTIPGQTSDWRLTGSVLSISEHSAGISSRQPAQPFAAAAEAQPFAAAAVEAQPFAAAEAAQPFAAAEAAQPFAAAAAEALDGRSGAPASVAAVVPPAAAAARLFVAAAAAQAAPAAEPGAVAVAVAQPGAVAQPVEFAAALGASARPAVWALEVLQWVWVAAVAVEPRLAFAPFPERSALRQDLEPIRRLSADPPGARAAHSFPALSDPRRLQGEWEPPLSEALSPADHAEQVSHSDSAHLEQVPSRPGAPEAPLCRLGPAEHWSSVTPGLEAAHWGLRWWATAYLALRADQTVRRACLAGLRD